MAITKITTLKEWFSQYKKPTSEQFAAIFDSFRHNSVSLAISEVTGLQQALDSKQSSANISSMVVCERINSPANQVLFNSNVIVFPNSSELGLITSIKKIRFFGTMDMAAVDGSSLVYTFGSFAPTTYIVIELKSVGGVYDNGSPFLQKILLPISLGIPNISLGESVGNYLSFDKTFDVAMPNWFVSNFSLTFDFNVIPVSDPNYVFERRKKLVKVRNIRGYVSMYT